MSFPRISSGRVYRIRIVVLLLGVLALVSAGGSYQMGRVHAAPTKSPAILAQVLNVDCPFSGPSIGSSFSKVQEIDTFNVQSAESLIEITFNGRLDVDSMTGNGVRFELRVDDAAPTDGRARAVVRSDETGNDGGIHVTMTGIFTALPPGTHTLSLWAQATNNGTATGVQADPGCFGADHAVVKEYLPFGTIALPLIITD